jgi:2-alkyl-3-oxoalkanoate reductase
VKIFVAGATGVVGQHLIPALVRAGHSVIGMTHTLEKEALVRSWGAEPVAADALDENAVMGEIWRAKPDVVVHQLTAIPRQLNIRKFDQEFAVTNRLRIESTDYLLAAAQSVGVRRFIAQSYAGWPYARQGGPVKTEEDPLDSNPPQALRNTLAAIKHLESGVTGVTNMQGVVLRYGAFYGPGTAIGEGGSLLESVRRHRLPIVGRGAGVWSFLHIADVADATLKAIEHGAPGIYNIVDDEPATQAEWLPALAAAVGAKPPRRVPTFLARLVAGEAGVVMMTEIRGASNAKAKRELRWQPMWPTWREGFRSGLYEEAVRSAA